MMEKQKSANNRGRRLVCEMTAVMLVLLLAVTLLPRILKAGQEEKNTQITGLNVQNSAEKSGDSKASGETAQETRTVEDTDPMYWMGQRTGGDTNRAMVWFGNYYQTAGGEKKPVLWRTLRSDGEGNYGGAVTLMSEYTLNAVWFDQNSARDNHYWLSKDNSKGSSDIRAWLNGVGTGAMEPDQGSRYSAGAYNQTGGGAGNAKGSFYANAFDSSEKELIKPTELKGEIGANSEAGKNTTDKIFILSSNSEIGETKLFSGNADRIGISTAFGHTGSNTVSGSTLPSAGGCNWWLRSPRGSDITNAMGVATPGNIGNAPVNNGSLAARPTLNLAPTEVLFTAASDSGGAPDIKSGLTSCKGSAPTAYSAAYNGGFRVFSRKKHPNENYSMGITGQAGSSKATVSYANAASGDYVTVLVFKKATGQKWCGRIGQVEAGGSGSAEFIIPDGQKYGDAGAYRLFAWTENEESKTAYLSDVYEPLGVIYKIHYDNNGGTRTMEDSEEVSKGDTVAAATNQFERTGCIFKEWNTEKDGSGTSYEEGAEVTMNSAVTLYAVWEKKTPAIGEDDPMYWMGQKDGADYNRAMVWFGNYQQISDGTSKPILWRTIESKGKGEYGGLITLLSEYSLNSVWFDQNSKRDNQHWCNANLSIGSSDQRAWMNGVGTGAMYPDVGSRYTDMPYNQTGGGKGNTKGSFYANAFSEKEKNMIAETRLSGSEGSVNSGRTTKDKIFALNYNDSLKYFSTSKDLKSYPTEFGYSADNTITGKSMLSDGATTTWWLRTPMDSSYPDCARGVGWDGVTGWAPVNRDWVAVRPALNFNADAIMFTAASDTGGESAAPSPSLPKCSGAGAGTYSSSYKGGFRVFTRAAHPNSGYSLKLEGKTGSTSATIRYNNATAGDYVTVLVVKKSTGEKWCGRVGKVPSGGSGYFDFTLPDGKEIGKAGDLRLFAWTENEASQTVYTPFPGEDLGALYHLTYDSNGGGGSMDSERGGEGDKLSVAFCEFGRSGYQFKEWNTLRDGSGTSYIEGDSLNITKDITLYAIWEKKLNPVGEMDPMYWMGQRSGGDTNRAMVWFGSYWQDADGITKSPVLWRTLRSDGQGNYNGAVTLLSEYVQNGIWFDQNAELPSVSWYNTLEEVGSSDLRVWMNGFNTGGMYPDKPSRIEGYTYNQPGGGAGGKKGSFYTNAFGADEKSLIMKTRIEGEGSYRTDDKIFALSQLNEETTLEGSYFSNTQDRVGYPTGFLTNAENTLTGRALVSNTESNVEWWLRSYSGNPNSRNARTIDPAGESNARLNNSDTIGARPALNLNPANVMFTASGPAGEAPATSQELYRCEGSAPTSFAKSYNGSLRIFKREKKEDPDYVLTISGSLGSSTGSVKYNGTAAGDYVTVLVVDTGTGRKWCGRIGQTASGGSGTLTFSLPDGQTSGSDDGFRVFAWTENESGRTAYDTIAAKNVKDLASLQASYDANGGIGTTESSAADKNKKAEVSVNKFSRDGYVFKDWNTEKDGSGDSYTEGSEIILTKDTVLYAIWQKRMEPVGMDDPMYWMGQQTGGDTNRAMVWFGNYQQTGDGKKKPVLWRTLRSDGQGNYGGAVTLLSEYGLNAVWFDQTAPYNQHWYDVSGSVRSSDLRVWMNGAGTGAMYPDKTSRQISLAYNQSGGGAGNTQGSFYANAFDTEEKKFIVPTGLAGESGINGTGGTVTDKIFALSGASLEAEDSALYFKDEADRVSYPTAFSMTEGTISGKAANTGTGGAGFWHFRSPDKQDETKGKGVGAGGNVEDLALNEGTYSARPALNLNPSTVIFTAASDEGGAPKEISDSLNVMKGTAPSSYSVNYAGGMRVFKRAAHPNAGYKVNLSVSADSMTGTVNYTAATPEDYVTALVVNTKTGRKWCGRVGQAAAGGSGAIEFTLPNEQTSRESYRVFAWTENEAEKTAYSAVAVQELTVEAPIMINKQPEDLSGRAGDNVVMNVSAYAGIGETLTYEWYITSSDTATGGTKIASGNVGSYSYALAEEDFGKRYYCVIKNSSNQAVRSQTADIMGYTPPKIKTHPANQARAIDETATFSVEGEGGNPTIYNYLWQYREKEYMDWKSVTSRIASGGTSSSLSITVSEENIGYQFRCYVGNSEFPGTGGTVSEEATLTAKYQITYHLNYTGAPEDTTVLVNTEGQVKLPSYSRSGYEFLGWASTQDAEKADAGKGGALYTPSENITLYGVWRAYVKPELDPKLPADTVVSEGKTVTFTSGFASEGSPKSYTYQWYFKDGTGTEKIIDGATGSAYSVSNVTASLQGYRYYCKIGHATSGTTQTTREAVLTVYGVPGKPDIQNIGGVSPFPWSSSADGQAFLPVKGTDVVGGTTLQYQIPGGGWKTFTGTKVVTITKDGIQETSPGSGESARIVVKKEGQNTVNIRAVNTSDNSLASETVTITTKLDYTAPTAKLNDGKGTIWDQIQNLLTFGKYYKENVVFTVTDIKDNPASGVSSSSGVKKTSYYIYEAKTSADEAELKSITEDNIASKSSSWSWKDYGGGSFTVSPDKKFVVYAKVEDHAGNLHFIGSDGLVADATNPEAEISQTPTGWTNGNVTLTTNASDALSQLADKPYSYDGGKTFVSSSTNSYDSNGSKTIQVKDKADNVLSKAYVISNIDKQKPEISASPGSQVSPAWVSGAGKKVNISLPASSAADKEVSGDTTDQKGKSGIAGVYLVKEANKGDTSPAESAIAGQLTLSGEGSAQVYGLEMNSPSATTSYYLRAKDNAGNWSTAADAHKVTIQVDSVKPAIGSAAASPSGFTNGTITVTASNITTGGSGLASVYLFKDASETSQSAGYEMTKSGDGSSYTITLPSGTLTQADCEGEKTWQVRAYNKAGAAGDPKAVTTKYDKTVPTLSAVQNPDKDGKGQLVYAQEKSIEITAKDSVSGLLKITGYKKNGTGGVKPSETTLWPKSGTAGSAGTTDEVKASYGNLQENGTYVIKAYDTAGNVKEQETEVTGIDRTAPDITGFKKHTEKTDNKKSMVVTFKVKDTESGIAKVVWGTETPLDLSAAKAATAGDIDGNQEAGDGYLWYHFKTTIKEANENYYVRAEDQTGNQSGTVMAYEAENLIDVSIPAKMMFAVIPELGGEKDSRLISPSYQIKNNNDRVSLDVGMVKFTPGEGGKIALVGGEALNGNELNLKAGKGSGAFKALETAQSLFALTQEVNAGELSFGTLNKAGSAGDSGSFSYMGSLYDYGKNGIIKQDEILRSRYTAEFHFSINLPE